MTEPLTIKSLGYLLIEASNLDAWEHFAGVVLGLPIEREDHDLIIRLDDRALRIRISEGAADDVVASGWEVESEHDLAKLQTSLLRRGVAVTELTTEEAQKRRVAGGIRFEDPEGARVEAFWGATSDLVSATGRYGAHFKTGDQGLGHIVLACRDKAKLIEFYTSVLGFRISDHIETEIVPGRQLSLSFMRCNPRHHSLALAALPQSRRLVHVMLETLEQDEVGRALQRCEEDGTHISMSLGRHSNDQMLSFYALSPSGFDVEYGWGGLEIDEASWKVTVLDRTSVYGHEFRRPPRRPS